MQFLLMRNMRMEVLKVISGINALMKVFLGIIVNITLFLKHYHYKLLK